MARVLTDIAVNEQDAVYLQGATADNIIDASLGIEWVIGSMALHIGYRDASTTLSLSGTIQDLQDVVDTLQSGVNSIRHEAKRKFRVLENETEAAK